MDTDSSDTGCAVLDFSPDETGKRIQLGSDIVDNLSRNGFFYLTSHGIPDAVIDDAFTSAKEFFCLPEEVKERYQRPRGVNDDTGFIPVNYERLSNLEATEAVATEVRESFNFYLHAKEKYPGEVPRFGSNMAALFKVSFDLCKHLLELIVQGLHMTPEQADTLRQAHTHVGKEGNSSKLRSLWYPPASGSSSDSSATRLGTHTDYGTLTVLFQDDTGGLEGQTRDGQWKSVKPLCATGKNGAILIQLGDMLQHWTSSRLHSSKHRVRLTNPQQSSKVRQSIAFFLHPDNDCLVSPLDGTKTDKDIRMIDFLRKQFTSTYGIEEAT